MILLAYDSLIEGERPLDAEAGVEERDAAVGFGSIIVVALILEDGYVAGDGKTMGETLRHIQLVMVVGSKLHHKMLPEGGRTLTDIHDDIYYAADDASHELSLGKRRALEVEAADDTARGFAFVVLHEILHSYFPVEAALGPTLKKIASCIGKHSRLDNKRTLYVGGNDIHLSGISD